VSTLMMEALIPFSEAQVVMLSLRGKDAPSMWLSFIEMPHNDRRIFMDHFNSATAFFQVHKTFADLSLQDDQELRLQFV